MRRLTIFLLVLISSPAFSQSNSITLHSDQSLIDNGFWAYVLPRFSLKHGMSVQLSETAGDIVVSTKDGTPIFRDEYETTFHMATSADGEGITRFADWLLSDVGQATIAAFQIDGVQPYFPVEQEAEVARAPVFFGDPVLGKTLSQTHCGRCHVISEENRFRGIGSTPSFMALRTMGDWYEKFEIFWTLNPHPVFVQVQGVTPDFDPQIPTPIHPVMLTLDDIENIAAYLSTVAPADLGAPIEAR